MPARPTLFVLYREAPFRVLFANGVGFAQPRRFDTRELRTFTSMEGAQDIWKFLTPEERKSTLIGKRSTVRARMKTEYLDG